MSTSLKENPRLIHPTLSVLDQNSDFLSELQQDEFQIRSINIYQASLAHSSGQG